MVVKPLRRWYQITLRTMLVVMTLLCVAPASYLAYERNRRQNRLEAVDAIQRLGGDPNVRLPFRSLVKLPSIFGEDIEVDNVQFAKNHRLTDADLRLLELFPELEQLELSGTDIGDEGLAHLAGLTNLNYLGLGRTRVTDAGLVHLKNMALLESLILEETQVTDDGLPHLVGLKSLAMVRLDSGTRVTKAAIQKFEKQNSGVWFNLTDRSE